MTRQAFTCCVSFTHQWAMYSLCCLTFTRLSSMKSILRTLNSPWNLSQVRLKAFNNCGIGIKCHILNCMLVCFLLNQLSFMSSEPLLAGLPQTVKFTVLTGHYSVKKGDALQFSNTDTMPILPSSSCTAHIRNPAAG